MGEPVMQKDSDGYSGFPTAKDRFFEDFLGAGGAWASEEYRREHDWYHYMTGYKDAADALMAHLEKTVRGTEKLGAPIVFLYRHHLELALKQLARDCGRLLGRDDVVRKTHRLDELWRRCLSLLGEVSECTTIDEMQQTTRLLDEFCRADPTSQAFRYPEDTKGIHSESGVVEVSLDRVREVVGKISLLLDCISTDLYAREFCSF